MIKPIPVSELTANIDAAMKALDMCEIALRQTHRVRARNLMNHYDRARDMLAMARSATVAAS